jgi:hypothetical protein
MGIFITISIIVAVISLIFTFMSAEKYSETTYSPVVLSFILLCVGIIFFSDIEIIAKVISIAIFAILLAITKSIWGKIEEGRKLIEKKTKNINMQFYSPEYYKAFQEKLDKQISSISGLLTGLVGLGALVANNGNYNQNDVAEIEKLYTQLCNEIKDEVKSYDMDNIIAYAKTEQITSSIQELLTKANFQNPESVEALKVQLIQYVVKSSVEDTNISYLKIKDLLADSSLHPVGIILNFAYTVGSVACIFLLPAIL